MTAPIHFHVDLDAFFATVEQLDEPRYRGKPVVVGGSAERRGVVSTCSYEARAYGIHSAMPMARAVQLCPHAIFLPGRMHRYQEKSRQVMELLGRFSPDIQQISIDEAFLDMTGTRRLFGSPEDTARQLKDLVKKDTGLTVSVGIASNRYIAKIASGLKKPDGLCVVEPGKEAQFMRGLPLEKMWGVGEKTRERLTAAGLSTTASLLQCSRPILEHLIGEAGAFFVWQAVRGIDPGIMDGESCSKSISTERTFPVDISDEETLSAVLLDMAGELMARMNDGQWHSRTVHLKLRYADFRTVSTRHTGETAVNDAIDLHRRAINLLHEKREGPCAIRLIGLGLFNVQSGPVLEQLSLFDTGEKKRRRDVETAIHDLEKKRGCRLVTRATLIKGPKNH